MRRKKKISFSSLLNSLNHIKNIKPNPMLSISPLSWGKELRQTMYAIVYHFTINTKSIAKSDSLIQFFNSLIELLPCEECKYHYITYLKNNPIPINIENKEILLQWLYQMHVEDDKRLSKNTPPLSNILERFEIKQKNIILPIITHNTLEIHPLTIIDTKKTYNTIDTKKGCNCLQPINLSLIKKSIV